jgi:hypothetical protein
MKAHIGVDADRASSLSERGMAVLEGVAAGEIAPSTAAELLSGLGAISKIVEVDELSRRLSEIESRMLKQTDDGQS